VVQLNGGLHTLTPATTFNGTGSFQFGGTFQVNGDHAIAGAVKVIGTGQVNLGGNDDFNGGLDVSAGTLNLAAGGNHLITASTLSSAGKLDLRDNKLVTQSPLGTWSVNSYTGVTGLIAHARNNGLWNGTGITSSTASGDKLHSLGVALADDVGRVGKTFGGRSIQSGDVLVMYTYGGDANLDGKINIDDYGLIDSHVGQSGTVFGWRNGDFNYDGKINIDDYGIIDGNIGAQGAPIPTVAGALALSGGVSLDGVSAVPEPGSMALLAMTGAAVVRRRRRRARVV
jgi:hypothetical protein